MKKNDFDLPIPTEEGLYLNQRGSKPRLFFENLEWLTTEETAIYLRKVSPDGTPQLNTIHQMVCRGLIRRRKFGGRLYFRRRELDYLIESQFEGGSICR